MEMTQDKWDAMTSVERNKLRDLSGLSPQLHSYLGWRVEVEDEYGQTRRFIVGQSTGWRPCHIELLRRDSRSGHSADQNYLIVRPLYRVRSRQSA